MAQILAEVRANEELLRRGFTVVRLVSAEDAAALLARVAALRPGEGFRRSRVNVELEFHTSLLDTVHDYRRSMYELIVEAFTEPLGRQLCDYRIVSGGLILKAPGAGNVELHHDWTMLREREQIAVNVWCPLIDVDEANGALRLVEGSHRLSDCIGAPHAPIYYQGYENLLRDRSVSVPLRAGEALVYDNTILHWSPPNRSAEARPVLALNCVPRSSTTVFYRFDEAGDRFELYDMEDGGFFEHSGADYFAGRIRRPSLGFVKNRNRQVPFPEFERRLARRRGSLWSRIAASLGLGAGN